MRVILPIKKQKIRPSEIIRMLTKEEVDFPQEYCGTLFAIAFPGNVAYPFFGQFFNIKTISYSLLYLRC